MSIGRDDLMLVARAVKAHKEANLKLAKALLEGDFPGSREWATLLEANNKNLNDLFNLIMSLNGPLPMPNIAAQYRTAADLPDVTQANVILAHLRNRWPQ